MNIIRHRGAGRLFPCALRRVLVLAGAFGLGATASAERLTLERGADEFVITSDASPTWRIVLATAKAASVASPGGGTIRSLYVPAGNPESLVATNPARFGLARWGLDSFEWRYIDGGKGMRAALGTTATLDSLEIEKETADEIVIRMAGQWRNVPRFTRTIRFHPRGCHVRIEADWDGPGDKRGMWWMLAMFRASAIDVGGITIHDDDTAAVPLPVAPEQVFPLPQGIGFPYEIEFPLREPRGARLGLRMNVFGTDGPSGLHYELWPEEKGFVKFFPRWVARPLERRRYVFDYAWTIAEAGEPTGPSAVTRPKKREPWKKPNPPN